MRDFEICNFGKKGEGGVRGEGSKGGVKEEGGGRGVQVGFLRGDGRAKKEGKRRGGEEGGEGGGRKGRAGERGGGGGGGGGQNSDFQPKTNPLHPSKLVFLAFWVAWARVAKSKNRFCNLVFWPVANPPQLPKMGFLAFCQAPSKPTKSQFGILEMRAGTGGGGGEQNSDFQPKTKPLHSSKLAFLAFWGLGQGWQNPKSKFGF